MTGLTVLVQVVEHVDLALEPGLQLLGLDEVEGPLLAVLDL